MIDQSVQIISELIDLSQADHVNAENAYAYLFDCGFGGLRVIIEDQDPGCEYIARTLFTPDAEAIAKALYQAIEND